MKYLMVLIGGAIGAVSRYVLSGVVHRFTGNGFPWGTLVVNLAGSFLIGFLFGKFEQAAVSAELKLFVFVGLLGGFTTFSSYGLETVNLVQSGEHVMALSNVFFSNILGIALVFAGFAASRLSSGS